jgi:hypothetical protein
VEIQLILGVVDMNAMPYFIAVDRNIPDETGFGELKKPMDEPLTDIELKVLKVAEKRGPGKPNEFDEHLILAAMSAELGHAVRLAECFPEYMQAVWRWAIGNVTDRADAQNIR